MDSTVPFKKENGTKISFEQLVELIGTTCDYKFCIVDTFYYVEEIRKKNKSLAFKSLRKRETKSLSN